MTFFSFLFKKHTEELEQLKLENRDLQEQINALRIELWDLKFKFSISEKINGR